MRKWISILLCFLTFSIEGRELKTLVLIIASDGNSFYKKSQEIWRSYMHLDKTHFDCYFVKANENQKDLVVMDEDTIWTKTKEQYFLPGLLDKSLIALESMLSVSDEYDYILRVNLSAFINFPELKEFLKTLPRKSCYAGIKHSSEFKGVKRQWVCGAGILISKDLALLLTEHKNSLIIPKPSDFKNIDDVRIGDFLTQQGIDIINGNAYEIYSCKDWANFQTKADKNNFYLLRFKVDSPDREKLEVQMKKELVRSIYKISI
jgi:hypothetical protein